MIETEEPNNRRNRTSLTLRRFAGALCGRKMIDETYEMCESIRHEYEIDIADG